jgi:hypothetical protein
MTHNMTCSPKLTEKKILVFQGRTQRYAAPKDDEPTNYSAVHPEAATESNPVASRAIVNGPRATVVIQFESYQINSMWIFQSEQK